MKRLRPAFVLTLAITAPACDKSGARGGNAGDPTTAVTGDQTPRKKRPMREALPEARVYSGTAARTSQNLHPVDAAGRTIYAGAAGTCFVWLPRPADEPPGPPGSAPGVQKVVDCPDAMLDPAWDTCLHDQLVKLESGECVCDRSGNPPPPPTLAECPASAK